VVRPGVSAIGPIRFMREMLCLSGKLRPIPRCGEPARFDVWSHHPYTQGSPDHAVSNRDSVSIAQLPRMARVLRAAARFGRIRSSRRVRFWVSEWGWDSNPPDPRGVPARLHARWISEALYDMWRAGVTTATWFFLRDGTGRDANFQSGLYLRCRSGIDCDRPKLAASAFRFPFVARRSHRRTVLWGRTPLGQPATVVVERSVGGAWRRVRRLRTDRYGIFTKRLKRPRRGRFRARLADGSAVSLPFIVKRTADFPVSPPVG
jgi:hypothetical protein